MNENFLKELAAKKPTPGGGGVAALLGAISSALGCMVCNFTIGKKKYAKYDEENQRLLNILNKNMVKFEELIELDAKAFEPLSKAYRLPSENDEEKKKKEEIIEPLLINSAMVPLKVMRLCGQTLEIISKLLNQSSVLVLSDVGVAASCCKSCIDSAALNVFINTKLLKNKQKREEIEKETHEIVRKYSNISEDIYGKVKINLCEE